jgi:glycosyltransferase involved in cell wall biosynthesis
VKSSPKISIVIPSYNKVGFVDRTLRSIFDQKYPSLEVIIQDGGSTDGTLSVVKNYSRKYPKLIKWESGKDKGQLDAINNGFRKATGDIYAYINADDVYERNAFSKVAESYKENPGVLWFAGRGKVIDGKGREIAKVVTKYKNLLLSLKSFPFLLVTNFLMQPSVFITKKAFRKYGPFTGTSDFVMEYALWLKLGRVQMPVVINRFLSGFRIEPSSKTSRMYKKVLAEDRSVVRRYTKNLLVLVLHDLHNSGRTLFIKD